MYQYRCINNDYQRRYCVWGSTGPVSCGAWVGIACCP
jgi:hypothetical protein